MSLVSLKVSLQKLREPEEFSVHLHANVCPETEQHLPISPFKIHFKQEINCHFYAWAWCRKKYLKSILCVTSVISRAACRKSSSLLKLKQGIALMENEKPDALFHIWGWVCVHERCTSHFPTESQFIYLPDIGVRKSRDSLFSSIGLISSGNLKTFTGFCQGLKSHPGTGTRDSCEHSKCSLVAWRGTTSLSTIQVLYGSSAWANMLYQWISKTNHDFSGDFWDQIFF